MVFLIDDGELLGLGVDYVGYIKQLNPALWFRLNELSGSIAINSGSLALPIVQILADGDMEAIGVVSWLNGSATLTKELATPSSGHCLRVAYSGTASPYTYQTVLTSGKAYRITGVARGDGAAANPRIFGGATVWTGTTSNTWQPFDVTFTASSTSIRFYNNTAGGYVEFDNIVLTESGYDGTYTACTLAQPGKISPISAALWDGTTSLVTVPPGAYANYPKFTIAMLMYATSVGEASQGGLYWWGTSSATHRTRYVGVGKTLTGQRIAATTAASFTTTTTFEFGRWQWYFETYDDSGDRKLYPSIGYAGSVNPMSLSAQAPAVNSLNNLSGQPLILGNQSTVGNTWDGLIDEFLYFDRVLTPQEMTQITRLSGV